MGERIRKKVYPELPLEDTTPYVPEYCDNTSQKLLQSQPIEDKLDNIPVKTITQSFSPNNDSHTPSCPDLNNDLPCPVQKHYKGFLEDYIEKIDEIIEKFEEIKRRAESHHYKSNCAKVSGTLIGSTGAAMVMSSLLWASFTAGSSLILGAGGAVMSVTGSLSNVVTDYIDYKTTAGIMEDIKLLLKEKEAFDIWMKKSLTHFNECIMVLIQDGCSKEMAISTVIEGIAKGAINIMEKPNNYVLKSLSNAVKLHRIEHLTVETLPIIGKTFHMTEKSFQFIYNILGLTGRTVPNLLKEFAKISGVLTVAFAVADISLLIKDLCSEHPSVDIIVKVVEQLKDERDILVDLVGILQSVEENKEGVLEKAFRDIEMIIDKDLLQDFVVVNDEELKESPEVEVQ
ncbi:hypothetical protein ABEB36_003873 [Hypothenemus hampei]|uniref:Apolipoprotein L3 n=1 Tax=Hypothenemus hampei TaxID=57062 RepID=A0ABD1F569_HYPHA